MKEILEKSGFTDIAENSDGTCDATKDNVRYTNLYVQNVDNIIDDDTVESIDCSFTFKN